MFEQFKLAEQLEMEKTLSEWNDLKYAVDLMNGLMKSRGATDCCVGHCNRNGERYQCYSLKIGHLPRYRAYFTGRNDQDCDIVRIWPTRGIFECQLIAVPRKKLIESFWCNEREIKWKDCVRWSEDTKFSKYPVEEAIQRIDAQIDNLISAYEIGKRMKTKMEKMLTLEFEKISEPEPKKKQ